MIPIIEHNNQVYPDFQAKGFAAKFAFPFALEVCRGVGYDIGCNRKEWCFPGAYPIDIAFNVGYDAYNLPEMKVDYIFSSHCIEHLRDWVEALDYWKTKLHNGGVLFLYLPHYSQSYWRSWHNRKHIHNLVPEVIKDYLTDRGWNKIFVSGADLNNSFYVMAEK